MHRDLELGPLGGFGPADDVQNYLKWGLVLIFSSHSEHRGRKCIARVDRRGLGGLCVDAKIDGVGWQTWSTLHRRTCFPAGGGLGTGSQDNLQREKVTPCSWELCTDDCGQGQQRISYVEKRKRRMDTQVVFSAQDVSLMKASQPPSIPAGVTVPLPDALVPPAYI